MPHQAVIVPMRGWTTDSPYHGVPEGFSHDLLNAIPIDSSRRRLRIGTRSGLNRVYKFESGSIQCLVRTSAFNGSPPTVKDRVFIVNSGKIWYMDPGDISPTQVLDAGANPSTLAFTNATVKVEGVQRGQYLYFVDGLNYRKVDLFASPPVWSVWSATQGPEDFVFNNVGGTNYTATLIALYGTRLVLAGVRQRENLWWMSSIQDPDHWSPNASSNPTADHAIAGNTGPWGAPGDEIVALIPFGQGSLIFAGKKSMSMLTQDPVFGSATIQQMSRTVGIVGPRAWCNGPEKTVYVMAQDGLYRLTPNDFNIDRGQLLSVNRLDSFFNQVKWEDIECVLSYDVERKGVWCFMTRTDQPSSSVHMFYSDQVDGFFPCRFYDPFIYGAYSECQMLTTDGRNQVSLFGSKNGMLAMFDQKILCGIDGYVASGFNPGLNPSLSESANQRIKTNIVLGPMISTQPGLAFCNEVQIELGSDVYLPDLSVKGIAPNPVAEILSAETAQEAVAESTTNLVVSDFLGIALECGGNDQGTPTQTYDGGVASDAANAPLTYLDGQYAIGVAGTYTTQDTFVPDASRIYEDSLSRYQLVRSSVGGANRWVIRFQNDGLYPVVNRPVFVQQQSNGEYALDPAVGQYWYAVTDETGAIQSTLSNVTVVVNPTTFDASVVTSLGNLSEGANNRMKCRVRANAMFLRMSSSGYPFSIERASMNLLPVGPRRTVIDV